MKKLYISGCTESNSSLTFAEPEILTLSASFFNVSSMRFISSISCLYIDTSSKATLCFVNSTCSSLRRMRITSVGPSRCSWVAEARAFFLWRALHVLQEHQRSFVLQWFPYWTPLLLSVLCFCQYQALLCGEEALRHQFASVVSLALFYIIKTSVPNKVQK